MTVHNCDGPILIVEDDANTLALIRTYMEREGFTTLTAADATAPALLSSILCHQGSTAGRSAGSCEPFPTFPC
jgi:hypothetical protein